MPDLINLLDDQNTLPLMIEQFQNGLCGKLETKIRLSLPSFFMSGRKYSLYYQAHSSGKVWTAGFLGPIEWQHKGSAHVHFAVWLSHVPDIADLHSNSGNELAEITQYFDSLVTSSRTSCHGSAPRRDLLLPHSTVRCPRGRQRGGLW